MNACRSATAAGSSPTDRSRRSGSAPLALMASISPVAAAVDIIGALRMGDDANGLIRCPRSTKWRRRSRHIGRRPAKVRRNHPMVAERRRVGNVVYYDYTSATIDYRADLDAFAVARADIYSTEHPHRLSLVMVATAAELTADRSAIEEAIVRARPLVERLVEEHRAMVDHLTATLFWVFNVAGQRIH